MKADKQHIIKVTSFILVLVLFIGILSYLFMPKDSVGTVLNEPDNSLDYLAFGDSECYATVSPMELWQKYGFVGYNCGVSRQRVQDTYYRIEKVLERQSPKVILLETNQMFRNQGTKEETQTAVEHSFGNAVPLYEFHDRWKQFISDEEDSDTDTQQSIIFKGMRYNTNVKPYTGGNYVEQTDDKEEIGPVQKLYFNKIVKLCQDRGITLILFCSPSPRCWCMERHNSIAQLAEENGLTFLDMNLLTTELGIDWSKDTPDKGDHMNFVGAIKVTDYLGKYMKEQTTLEDRRNDAAYSAWNDALQTYLSTINKS